MGAHALRTLPPPPSRAQLIERERRRHYREEAWREVEAFIAGRQYEYRPFNPEVVNDPRRYEPRPIRK